MQILAANSAKLMPWKNGLGTTLELATDASDANAAQDGSGAWSWRLSIADVPSRSPCSTFTGMSRTILCLGGDGLLLERAHGTDAVPLLGSALLFEGEEQCVCVPLSKDVRDINLLFDRAKWNGVLRLVRATAGAITGEVVLVHVPTLSQNDITIDANGESVLVRRGETLVSSGFSSVMLKANEVCILAALTTRSAENDTAASNACCGNREGSACACGDACGANGSADACCAKSKKM